jgi:hypothetical protein
VTISRADFIKTVFQGRSPSVGKAAGAANIKGSTAALEQFASWIQPPNGNFRLVTRDR